MIGNVTVINGSGVEKHSYRDFGLLIKTKVISAPEPQLHEIEVFGRDGTIDITEVATGNVRYKKRSIKLELRYIGSESTRTSMLTDFENFIHGKLIKYIFDDDASYYYIGRMRSCEPQVAGGAFDLSTELTVQPYKYNIESTADDWLWDPFDFETGVINELHSITVHGTATVTLIGSPYQDNPVITVTSPMTVSYDGGTPINLVAGSQKVYDIIITSGEHEFVFVGEGTATIDYRGGLL